MSPAELPDDIRHWPKEPFKLLGVDTQADERTLKRAYTQLIRKYKPETSPEQFKLIRAAYEQAQSELEYQTRFRQHFPNAAEEAGEPQATEQQPSRADRQEEGQGDTAGDNSFGDEKDIGNRNRPGQEARPAPKPEEPSPWDLAKQGKIRDAFTKLQAAVENEYSLEPVTANTLLQMYWLARVFPELQQSPLHWLAEGIRRFTNSYSVFETLRQATEEDSHIVLSQEVTAAIFEKPGAEGIIPYLNLRWQTIAKHPPLEPPANPQFHQLEGEANAKRQSLKQILTELELLRDKLKFDNETLWGRIIIIALESYLVGIYFADQPLFGYILAGGLLPLEPYFEELRTASHLHRPLESQLDRLDELNLLTRSIAREGVPNNPFGNKWGSLILQNTVSSAPEVLTALPSMIEDLIKDPFEGLSILDALTVSHPLQASLLRSAIRQYAESREVDLEQEPVVYENFKMSSKLEFMVGGSYSEDYRPYIAFQSFHWAVQPMRALQKTAQLGSRFESLKEWVEQDDALNSIYLAWYAFHYVKEQDSANDTANAS